MNRDAVVVMAQRRISLALRGEPIESRAELAFDPLDTEDVRLWVSARLESASRRSSMRYAGSVSHAVQALYWDALNEARRVRRRGSQKRESDPDLVEQATGQMVNGDSLSHREAIEWMAISSAKAALSMVCNADRHRNRRVAAALSCLARTVAAILESFGSLARATYVECLVASQPFSQLLLTAVDRAAFRDAVMQLHVLGNFRRDLAGSGLAWAGARPWNAFSEHFNQLCSQTTYSGQHEGNR